MSETNLVDPTTSQEEVFEMLREVVFMDFGTFATWGKNGLTLKESEELTPVQRMMITKIKEDQNGCLTFEIMSKDQAIRLLAQSAGLLVDRKEIRGQLDVALIDVLKTIDGQAPKIPALLEQRTDE